MADIVNLRQMRKRKARAEADRQADENRVAFGRTKRDKERSQAEADAARSFLDGHRREPRADGT